jgi:regulator of cell morphogenesis and NO signaling
MYKTSKYTPTDKMSYLICDNYTLLQVMSRFDLSLGFGDKTVQEVCRENGVDCRTFLAVVNFMIEDSDRMEDDVKDISMLSLMNYLKQAHHYFLDFCLPTIRRKLIEAIDCSTETASSSTANIPPKPQHSSLRSGSTTSTPSTKESKSRNLLK